MSGDQDNQDGNRQEIIAGKREAVIQHAVRCWDSARENAARIEARRKLLSAAIVGLFGLGLFRVDWFYDPEHVSRVNIGSMLWSIKLLLVYSIYRFAIALFVLYRQAGDIEASGRTANEELAFKPEDSGIQVRKVIVKRTYAAYLDLQKRNARHWIRLREGQRLFGQGFIAVLLALILFVLSSSPPILSIAENDGLNTPTSVQPEKGDNHGR